MDPPSEYFSLRHSHTVTTISSCFALTFCFCPHHHYYSMRSGNIIHCRRRFFLMIALHYSIKNNINNDNPNSWPAHPSQDGRLLVLWVQEIPKNNTMKGGGGNRNLVINKELLRWSLLFLKVILQSVHVLRRARTTDDRREGARGVALTTRWEYDDEDSLNKKLIYRRGGAVSFWARRDDKIILFRLSEEEFSQRGDGLT